MGLTSWASRAAQVEATVNTVQKGHCAIVEAVVEERTKARGPGHPCGMTKVMKTTTAAYDIEEWMRGVEEDAPKRWQEKGSVAKCRPEPINTHSQCTSQGSRQHKRQGSSRVPRYTSVDYPLQGVGVLMKKKGCTPQEPVVTQPMSLDEAPKA